MHNRTPVTTRFLALLAPLLLALLMGAAKPPESGELRPEAKQKFVEQLITSLLSRYHYAEKDLNDDMSSRILERYLKMLDGSHSYFLASDVEGFREKYRHALDDALRNGNLEPAFDIYNVYRRRLEERIDFVLRQLETKPDFTLDEEFVFDRRELAWPANREEYDEIWRKRVKNDAIGLLLADKTWEEARDLLRDRYRGYLSRSRQVDSGDVFELFINAYAHTLDPHTLYLSPHDSEEFEIRMSLSYEGIGAALQTENEYVKIVRILPGGSAAESGALKPNDRITAVAQGPDGDWVEVIGWRLEDVVDLIRGPADTTVRLQILPAGMPPGSPQKTISLARSEIQLEEQAAQSEVIEVDRGGETFRIGLITVPAFYMDYQARLRGDENYRSTTRDVRRLIGELKNQDIDGLVMDLRDNGGGSLQEAVELTGLFLDEGPVVQVRSSQGEVEVLEDTEPGAVWDGPLAVIVNRFSASASEIFAGAIQDYGRGLVVGTTTFGKGTVQNLWDLSRFLKTDTDLGQVKMTIGKYYRVSGSSTQHQGVSPDIELPSAVDLDEFGESSEPSALPWDRIQAAANPQRLDELRFIKELNALHRQRAEGEAFRLLARDIAEFRKNTERRSVSLNLEERRAELTRERAEALRRENAWRATQGLPPLESLDAAVDEAGGARAEQPDVWLQESAQILVDLIKLQQGASQQQLAAAEAS